MVQENSVKSDEHLYRELKWLCPTTILNTYVKAGRWYRELLLLDLELIKAHRREAGAPEPSTPLDLKQVLPELHGRVIRAQDAEGPASLPAPPAAPARVPNGQDVPDRAPGPAPPPARPARPAFGGHKPVSKDGMTKGWHPRPGQFALGNRSPPYTRFHGARAIGAPAPGGAVQSSVGQLRARLNSDGRSALRGRPVMTQEVKSLHHRDHQNGQEARPRPSDGTCTTSVRSIPRRSGPEKGVVKDGITKSSVRRPVPTAPLGARSSSASSAAPKPKPQSTPKAGVAKPGASAKQRPLGQFSATGSTPSSASAQRSAPKGPTPPKGAPPPRAGTPTPPKGPPPKPSSPAHGPPQSGAPSGPKGPTESKGKGPPRGPPRGPPPKGKGGPPKDGNLRKGQGGPPKGAPSPKGKGGPSPPSAPPRTAKESAGAAPVKRPTPPSGPPKTSLVKPGGLKATPKRPAAKDGSAPRPSSASSTGAGASAGSAGAGAKAASRSPGDLIRKLL